MSNKFLQQLSKIKPVHDPSKAQGPYRTSLIRATRAGTIFTFFFFMFFAAVYWFSKFPLFAVWVNLFSVLCSLIGYLIVKFTKHYRPAAYLVTFAIYISSAGVMLVSGGIRSSSAIWQVYVPVAAFIMAGIWAGIRWGGISLVTIIIFFIFDRFGLVEAVSQFQTTLSDLFLDLSGAIAAVSIAIWYSDTLKSQSFSSLEKSKEELNFFATIDPLTNTYNRRYFLEQSQRRIHRTRSSNGLAAFLLFDIDHFKNINDTYGHIVGDHILKGLANLCINNLRPDDLIGRFGGEEFVILLPNTEPGDARRIAERLRMLVESTPFQTEIGPLHITISIGISNMHQADTIVLLDQLIFRADKAMYRAKQEGRNRVIEWDQSIA
ncbi:MAG: GGDEF domain-containing protein [Anaerolineales bacterium]|nr:GGDEF domain-containing protein [Anaerolineales bacterium]